MSLCFSIRTLMAALFAILAVGACAARTVVPAGSQAPNAVAARERRPPGTMRLLYAAVGNGVQVYDTSTWQRIGTITKGLRNPTGLAVDGSDNLYVLGSKPYYYGEKVWVYAPGATSPSEVLTNVDDSSPYGIAVDAIGTVYVA